MKAEEFKPSDYVYQVCGAVPHFMASSRSSMLGPNQQSPTSPLALEKSPLFMVLDQSQWAQDIEEKIVPWAFFWTHGPPEAPRNLGPGVILVLGDSNSPHGPQTVEIQNSQKWV
ncbi:hypothetical protein O181_060078 [Austropuccinia psidii MF-1]|uniref:Uncharacterized protein n=1 Tax=Austropuccinia psidii MF-1 TaxID=1389203 RepID=A0A9Q3EK17_9BASI|nr:hypothetical protein [Austropuccinia psidii MF-1]